MISGAMGGVFDEDDIFSSDGGGSSDLELDVVRVTPQRSPAAVPPEGGPAQRSSPAERFGANARLGGVELTANEMEARALAEYGESPRSFWQAPLYAYRVKTRQAELRRQLEERRQDLARAHEAYEEAKFAFAERARPVAQKVETFAKLLEVIQVAEGVVLDRDSALSVETEAHKGQLRVIDDRVLQLEAELAEANAEEIRVEEMLAEAEAVRQRAEAKMKRVEIEIRNASARADVEGSGKRAPWKGAGTPS